VDGEVDAAFEERVLDFLGEEALGADAGEGDVGDLVAGGLDDFEFGFYTELGEACGDPAGLPQGELRAAASDFELHESSRRNMRRMTERMRSPSGCEAARRISVMGPWAILLRSPRV